MLLRLQWEPYWRCFPIYHGSSKGPGTASGEPHGDCRVNFASGKPYRIARDRAWVVFCPDCLPYASRTVAVAILSAGRFSLTAAPLA
jgi:hypothetical protein